MDYYYYCPLYYSSRYPTSAYDSLNETSSVYKDINIYTLKYRDYYSNLPTLRY